MFEKLSEEEGGGFQYELAGVCCPGDT